MKTLLILFLIALVFCPYVEHTKMERKRMRKQYEKEIFKCILEENEISSDLKKQLEYEEEEDFRKVVRDNFPSVSESDREVIRKCRREYYKKMRTLFKDIMHERFNKNYSNYEHHFDIEEHDHHEHEHKPENEHNNFDHEDHHQENPEHLDHRNHDEDDRNEPEHPRHKNHDEDYRNDPEHPGHKNHDEDFHREHDKDDFGHHEGEFGKNRSEFPGYSGNKYHDYHFGSHNEGEYKLETLSQNNSTKSSNAKNYDSDSKSSKPFASAKHSNL